MYKSFLILLFAPLAALAYASPGTPTGFVNDFAELIAPEAQVALETKLAEFARTSPAVGGAGGTEIVVATIPTLGGDTIENFANKIFSEWGVGKKGQDNGALILIARDEREVRIEVGYGLEPVLTDAAASAIIRNDFAPHFVNGDFASGLAAGTARIISIVSVDEPSPILEERVPSNFSDYFFLILFVPLWLASILSRSKSWWAGGVVGGVAGVALGIFFGFLYFGLTAIALLVPLGLLFDFLVSRAFARSTLLGRPPPWWAGGAHIGGGWGGGFGGCGGGSSGAGGASGSY